MSNMFIFMLIFNICFTSSDRSHTNQKVDRQLLKSSVLFEIGLLATYRMDLDDGMVDSSKRKYAVDRE
jgi:hypothetical protein